MIEECVYGCSPSMVATGVISDEFHQNSSYTYFCGLNESTKKDVTIADIYRAINNLNSLLKQYFSMDMEISISRLD